MMTGKLVPVVLGKSSADHIRGMASVASQCAIDAKMTRDAEQPREALPIAAKLTTDEAASWHKRRSGRQSQPIDYYKLI
jgi:hypothetical protein